MAETRRKFDEDFKEGAVRLVRETRKPIAQVARGLGINEGTLGNWVGLDRRGREGGGGRLSEDERAELACACREPRPRHATRRYSLIMPPMRACLRTRYRLRSTGSGSGFSRAAALRSGAAGAGCGGSRTGAGPAADGPGSR